MVDKAKATITKVDADLLAIETTDAVLARITAALGPTDLVTTAEARKAIRTALIGALAEIDDASRE